MNLTIERALSKKLTLFVLFFIFWSFFIFLQFQFVGWVKIAGDVGVNQTISTLSISGIIILTIIIYPILEEIIFRLPLRVKVFNILVSLMVALWYFLFKREITTFFIEQNSSFNARLLMGLLLSSFLVILFLRPKNAEVIIKFLQGINPWLLIFVSAFLFAWGHLSKLNYNTWFYGALFMLMVYFVPGLFLGYVRLKLNIWIALFFHVIINAIPYIIVLYYSIKTGENAFMFLSTGKG